MLVILHLMDVYCWCVQLFYDFASIAHFCSLSAYIPVHTVLMHDCLVSESIIHSDRLTALQGVKGLVMVLSECPVGYPEVRLVVLVFFSHCLWHQVLCGCQLQTGQVRIVLLCCVVLLPSTPCRQLFEALSRIMFCISVHMLIIHYRSFAATPPHLYFLPTCVPLSNCAAGW